MNEKPPRMSAEWPEVFFCVMRSTNPGQSFTRFHSFCAAALVRKRWLLFPADLLALPQDRRSRFHRFPRMQTHLTTRRGGIMVRARWLTTCAMRCSNAASVRAARWIVTTPLECSLARGIPLDAPVASESSSAFGQMQAANPPRIMQLAGKYTF